jgi:hypothetical protein
MRLGDNFYMGILYGDHADSELQRTGKSNWSELKFDDVEELTRRMFDFGIRKLEIPDLISTLNLREVKSSDWSESTRIS